MVVRVSQAVRGGRLERRSKLAQATGLPESQAPPPRLAAESTAEEPPLAGGLAGGRDREGELRADGAGLGRAPPPPKDLGTWIARDRAVSPFKAEQKWGVGGDIKKDRKELKLDPRTWKPHPLLPTSP
jgi:hypothetical protein